jgi:aryl-alcohol dehydrogenase-like predicted oxidoreductase
MEATFWLDRTKQSFKLLDAFVAHGLNLVDTANNY